MLKTLLETDTTEEHTYYHPESDKYYQYLLYFTKKDEMVILFSDITASHKVHLALKHNEEILRNIYQNLPAGIELYDLEMFGLKDKREVLGVNLFSNPYIPEEVKI